MEQILMKIFSFCVYGKNKIYYHGLLENIRIIKENFPDFLIYVYVGSDYLQDFLNDISGIQIIATNTDTDKNTLYRYLPILEGNVDLLFVRDTDSEVNERDRWCINKFIESDLQSHAIRDHFWHKSRFMAGTSGFKKGALDIVKGAFAKHFKEMKESDEFFYGKDEVFLEKYIYPLVKNNMMVHTNINAHKGEKYFPIECENNNLNFVGNVMNYDKNGKKSFRFRYDDFNFAYQIKWLLAQEQWQLILDLAKNMDIHSISFDERPNVLNAICLATFHMRNMNAAMVNYKRFEFCEISEYTIQQSNCFYQIVQMNGKKVVASSVLSYEPADDEVVFYYGKYPINHMMLPQSNKIYRNVFFFSQLPHEKIVYDKHWELIDQIYIINLEVRSDRYIEIMGELAAMGCPLDRVYHYKAKKDGSVTEAYVGATKNHVDVIKHMIDNNYNNCLFLEDDFVFTSSIDRHKHNLKTFLEREYDFDICFVAASRFHRREKHDDLLMLSHQGCTTSAGYILNKKTVKKVYNCVLEGYEKIKETGDADLYCIDRYWAKLNKDNKLFIFREKMGYQRPNYSNLKNTVSMFFD